MKTISTWSYSVGINETNIHDIPIDRFKRLIPAFDEIRYDEKWDAIGIMHIDKDTDVNFYCKITKEQVEGV